MKEILQTKMFKQQTSVLCLMHVHLHPFHVDPAAKNVQVINVEGAEPEEGQQPEEQYVGADQGQEPELEQETNFANPESQQGKPQFIDPI